jgi:hypothetical protein
MTKSARRSKVAAAIAALMGAAALAGCYSRPIEQPPPAPPVENQQSYNAPQPAPPAPPPPSNVSPSGGATSGGANTSGGPG